MSNALEVRGNTTLAPIPEHLRGDVGSRDGKEGVGQADLILARLKLAQNLSNEMKKSNENYNPELEEGQFFNSVTGEIYGNTVTVIPLHFFNEYIEFDADTRKVVKYYQRGEVPPAEDLVVVNGQKPKVTTFKNRMSLLVKEDGTFEPIVVGFKYVGKKTPTNKWNYLIAEKNLPAYAYTYKLESTTVSNDKGEWAGGKFTRLDFTPAAIYEQAKSFFAALQEAGVKVDVADIDQEQETNDTDFDQ